MPLCAAFWWPLAAGDRRSSDPDPSRRAVCAGRGRHFNRDWGGGAPSPVGMARAVGPGIPSFQGMVLTVSVRSLEVTVLRARAPSVPVVLISTQFFSDATSVPPASR